LPRGFIARALDTHAQAQPACPPPPTRLSGDTFGLLSAHRRSGSAGHSAHMDTSTRLHARAHAHTHTHRVALLACPPPVPALDHVLAELAQGPELGIAVQLDLVLCHGGIPANRCCRARHCVST